MPKDWTTILNEALALGLEPGDTIEVVLKMRGEDPDQVDRAVSFLHDGWRAAELRKLDDAGDPTSPEREEAVRKIDQRVNDLREQAELPSGLN